MAGYIANVRNRMKARREILELEDLARDPQAQDPRRRILKALNTARARLRLMRAA